MKTEGYIDEYPCKCSGGDMCYIVRHPKESIDIGYPTKEQAERALEELNKRRDWRSYD